MKMEICNFFKCTLEDIGLNSKTAWKFSRCAMRSYMEKYRIKSFFTKLLYEKLYNFHK